MTTQHRQKRPGILGSHVRVLGVCSTSWDGPGKTRLDTKSIVRSNDESFCVIMSNIVIVAFSLCVSMSSTSPFPSHTAMDMRPRASTCMAYSPDTDTLASHENSHLDAPPGRAGFFTLLNYSDLSLDHATSSHLYCSQLTHVVSQLLQSKIVSSDLFPACDT